jgi:hypothetical protein
MPVNREDVQKGRCFRTSTNQVRRVLKITEDDHVQYEARGSRGTDTWNPGSTLTNPPTRAQFAADVEEHVRCDWDINYTNPEPTD